MLEHEAYSSQNQADYGTQSELEDVRKKQNTLKEKEESNAA
jgi:hypothetical protein